MPLDPLKEPSEPDGPSVEVSEMDMTEDEVPQLLAQANTAIRREKRQRQRDTVGKALVELASLPERTIVDVNKLADLLDVSKSAVYKLAKRGDLPPPVLFARRSYWFVGHILDHFEEQAKRAAKKRLPR
jgi:predicted DNA-binding transcriptional regulator AlpA